MTTLVRIILGVFGGFLAMLFGFGFVDTLRYGFDSASIMALIIIAIPLFLCGLAVSSLRSEQDKAIKDSEEKRSYAYESARQKVQRAYKKKEPEIEPDELKEMLSDKQTKRRKSQKSDAS